MPDRPPATSVILDLLSTEARLTSAEIVRAGHIMRIGEGPMRVALSRLLRQEKVENIARGAYRLHPSQARLNHDIGHWFERLDHRTDWHGDFVAVLAPRGLSQVPKTARRHALALSLRGFRNWQPGVSVRPNNLTGGPAGVRDDLASLGMASGCSVTVLLPIDRTQATSLERLWPIADIKSGYATLANTLLAAEAALGDENRLLAARASLMVGRHAIRQIMLDPLLPDEILPAEQLRHVMALLKRYQDRSRDLWRTLLATIDR